MLKNYLCKLVFILVMFGAISFVSYAHADKDINDDKLVITTNVFDVTPELIRQIFGNDVTVNEVDYNKNVDQEPLASDIFIFGYRGEKPAVYTESPISKDPLICYGSYECKVFVPITGGFKPIGAPSLPRELVDKVILDSVLKVRVIDYSAFGLHYFRSYQITKPGYLSLTGPLPWDVGGYYLMDESNKGKSIVCFISNLSNLKRKKRLLEDCKQRWGERAAFKAWILEKDGTKRTEDIPHLSGILYDSSPPPIGRMPVVSY